MKWILKPFLLQLLLVFYGALYCQSGFPCNEVMAEVEYHGAVKFMSNCAFLAYPGSETYGSPEGTFVTTREIGRLLWDEYKKGEITRSQLAARLGIVSRMDCDFFDSGDSIVMIYVCPEAITHLRTPVVSDPGVNTEYHASTPCTANPGIPQASVVIYRSSLGHGCSYIEKAR